MKQNGPLTLEGTVFIWNTKPLHYSYNLFLVVLYEHSKRNWNITPYSATGAGWIWRGSGLTDQRWADWKSMGRDGNVQEGGGGSTSFPGL